MGYYDNEGQYHSFRSGLRHAADNILHPFQDSVNVHEDINISERSGGRGHHHGGIRERTTVRYDTRHTSSRNTVTIPCHFIRIGDILILQGRPCQVIRITTSAATGQHRYLGVDLFTKQLQEESSFMSNPSPSVYVQNMRGPVFKQYRVLDLREEERRVVCMTETGDVKQGLPVLDQSKLFERIRSKFAGGRGSVRVLVISDEGSELVVDMKLIHGSRL
ncbi:translation protein SH3-like domain-containing protein [Neohortaea acidophila]|uniref:Translation protein SH3-like domain-containing protein n=1 Tax=Neohortaea acidophila TaxID=245834 RepID=A0A6A6PSD9_9PEZI|nr:translation protein SH3-like domain-containing protein [Neohortaea acidophila]KAF2482696.1 translation protein SH3-like domain-containing protein [Neohortaea acidophila]